MILESSPPDAQDCTGIGARPVELKRKRTLSRPRGPGFAAGETSAMNTESGISRERIIDWRCSEKGVAAFCRDSVKAAASLSLFFDSEAMSEERAASFSSIQSVSASASLYLSRRLMSSASLVHPNFWNSP